jgi:hypothetical protein
MKKLVRTVALLVPLALAGTTSSSALFPGQHPGDCFYECYNPTTNQTIEMKTSTPSYAACCSPNGGALACPAGSQYAGSLSWVNPQAGPQLCTT